jgi:hypothetical protein
MMTLFPTKFLWQDLLSFWQDKSGEVISQGALIISKMDVLADPGVHMDSLMSVLAQRGIFAKLLTGVDRIKLTIPRLTAVLEKLAPL